MSEPRFAVVGHPNKGKSSIVATLAADDAVRVAPEPGTTTRSREFPMSVDGRTLYTLIDTPGFQRARRAREWMKQRTTTADQQAQLVADFIAEHDRAVNKDAFPDEVELLRPIMDQTNPAGILYVVDGSVPYGPEYEAEMEILRWTGRPSLALINPIGEADHVEAWRAALGQHFKIVRVFNAVTAEFDKRLELLRAFGQLREAWRNPLDQAVIALQQDRQRRRRESAREITTMLAEALSLSVTQKLGPKEDSKKHRPQLLEKFKGQLRRREQRSRERIESVYDHHKLDRQEADAGGELEALAGDLFSQEAWLLFGLRRRDLVVAGVGGGAMAGGTLDVAAGGSSFLLGAAIGAVVGGTMGWLGADRLASFKVINRPLGGKLLRCGPTKNPNFPFVLLGRARLHHALVAGRTHAQRGALEMDEKNAGALNPLTDEQRKALGKSFVLLAKASGDVEKLAEHTSGLTETVENILVDDERG